MSQIMSEMETAIGVGRMSHSLGKPITKIYAVGRGWLALSCRPDAREAIGSIKGSKLDVDKFSRELSSKNAICHRKRCTLHLNSLENSNADRHDSCHPSVTLVTLEKGCKRPVYRHSVTLSPFFEKILVYNEQKIIYHSLVYSP